MGSYPASAPGPVREQYTYEKLAEEWTRARTKLDEAERAFAVATRAVQEARGVEEACRLALRSEMDGPQPEPSLPEPPSVPRR